MARREYTAGRPTTLSEAFAIDATTFTIADDGSAITWPTSNDFNFWVTIDAGTAQEERVLCSARTGRVVTVADGGRGVDGTTESNHSIGATVWPSWSATDADETNAHIESTGYASYSRNVHGLGSGEGVVVGTTKEQTLTLKTLTSPKINENVALTATSTELNYVDGVTSSIQTQLNAKAPLASPTFTGTVTLPDLGSGLAPVGSILMYGGTTAPTGWLLCNGQSTTGYTALAAIVGANVPDLMGRAPIGYGSGTGLTARGTIGAKVGAETHALTESEMPRHNHSSLQLGGAGGSTGLPVTGTVTTDTTTGFTGGDGAGNAENGIAHPNMQPSTVVNFIIKT